MATDTDGFGGFEAPPGFSQLNTPNNSILYLGPKLGEGTYGTVFRGIYCGRDVAVKVTTNADTRSYESLREEIEVMKKLKKHPNVVEFIDAFEIDDSLHIIMEFCEGGTVESAMLSGMLTIQSKLKIAHQIALGVAYLHSMNIVHRDLACRNILLSADHTPKVSDFGLSRVLESPSAIGMTGSTFGPLRWMAPESLQKGQYSIYSDIWMLGCLIVELITESRPHCDVENMIDACRLVTEVGKVPPIPEEFAVPEDLRKLIGLCCVWRPEGRINAQEVVRILNVLTTTSEELSSKLARASIMVDASAVKLDTPLVREEAIKKQLQPTHGVFKLGSGGAGEVLLVEWNGLLAAKKQLKSDSLDIRSTESLAAELRVFLDIQHPNLLKLHAACFSATDKFLLLEYLSHGDLSSLIHAPKFREELAWKRRGRDMALQIARGLLALHANSCVHRDIKTSNVLVSGDWKAKISDFGQSKLKTGSRAEMEQTLTPAGERQRSAAYASPEQLSDTAPVLFPSDIYSFGVVLWEIYTQQPPFAGKSMIQVLMAISAGRTLELPTSMPPLLRFLIAKCWKPDPAERPTAQDCVDVLQELVLDEDPTSPSPLTVSGGGEESLLGTKTRRRVREARIFPITVLNAVVAAAPENNGAFFTRSPSRTGSKSAGPLAPTVVSPQPQSPTSTTAPASMVTLSSPSPPMQTRPELPPSSTTPPATTVASNVPVASSVAPRSPTSDVPGRGRLRSSVAPPPVARETSGNWNTAFVKQRQLNQIATLQTEMATTVVGGEGCEVPLSPTAAENRGSPLNQSVGATSPEPLARTRSRRLNGSILPAHLEGTTPLTASSQSPSPTLGSGNIPVVKNDQVVGSKNFVMIVKGATLERLIQQLCTSAKLETVYGDNFRELFLLTYRTLLRPADLFGHIVARMNAAYTPQPGVSMSRTTYSASSAEMKPPSQEATVAETRVRLASVLQDWLSRHRQDFDSTLKHELFTFLNRELVELKGAYDQLIQLAERGSDSYHDLSTMQFAPGIIPKNPASYEEYDATEIARQLCLIQHTHFVSILSHEIVYSHRPQPPTPTTNVRNFMAMSDHIRRWVIAHILSASNVKTRGRYLGKIQSVIVKLVELNNFETASIIFAAISHPSVYRLRTTFREAKDTFKESAKKRHPQVKKWDEMELRLIEWERDWKIYNHMITLATAPGLPSLTWTINRLAMLDETMPHLLANAEGRTDIINYDKMREMGECVAPILRFQKTPYEFQPIPVIQHLFLAGAPGHNAQPSSLLLSLAYPQYMNLSDDDLQAISEKLE